MEVSRRSTVILGATAAGTMLTIQTSAQALSSLDVIKKSGKLRVGVATAEPWFSKDPMTGTWSGVCVEMGKQLAADIGVEMVPVETTFANAVAALQAEQIDIMYVMDPTEERRKAIDFPAAPLCYYALGVLAKADSTVTAWTDLDKPSVRVGVTLGTTMDKFVTSTLKTSTISRFSNNDEAIAAFAARRVDVVAQFHPALVVQYSRLKVGKVILPAPVEPVASSAGVRKASDTTFRDFVSERFAANYAADKPQTSFVSYMKSKGIDPTSVPGLNKDRW